MSAGSLCCSLADESERRWRDERANKQGSVESSMCHMDTVDWLCQSLCQRDVGAGCASPWSESLYARRSQSTTRYVPPLCSVYMIMTEPFVTDTLLHIFAHLDICIFMFCCVLQ